MSRNSSNGHYEYVLIGSGVAASTVAKRLLEHDRSASILMLEAGDRIEAKDRRAWWDYVVSGELPYDYTYDKPGANPSVGNTEWRMEGTRVTAYGGTTMHWGGWALRMKPEDFYLYTNTGTGGDWLVDYDDLEPYYCQAEKHLSVCGDDGETWTPRSEPYPLPPYPWLEPDMEMVEAFQEHGIRPGRMPLARYRKCMTTGTCRYCPFGARFSGQYVNEELEDEESHPNFEIRDKATVKRIKLASKRKASAVVYLDRRDGDEKTVTAERFIICAGAFESPKILKVSGIGNDLVGRYLVSHSFLSVTGTAVSNENRMVQEFGFPTLMSRTYDDEAHQAGGKIFMFRNFNMPRLDFAGLMQNGKRPEQIHGLAAGPRQTCLSAFFEETGKYENCITLKDGEDQFGLPLMNVRFDRDEKVMRDANKRLAEMGKIFASMTDYTITKNQFEGAAGYHASGTCRMGRTPEEGVTDAELRVHGVDNLFVCSNAVFPSVGAVNPTLTLTALAFRLADRLISGEALR